MVLLLMSETGIKKDIHIYNMYINIHVLHIYIYSCILHVL